MADKTIRVKELVDGQEIFKSHGISKLKVTKGEDVITLEIPIKSTGVSDVIDESRRKAPTPPVITIVVRPGDPAFKELGLARKKHVQTYDFTDKVYIEKKDKFETDLGIKILSMGLGVDLKDEDKKIITDPDKKIEMLKKQGMTGQHFTQIIEDINALTRWEDENEDDFLPSS